MRSHLRPLALLLTAGTWLATPALAEPFFFTTGNADGRLAALSGESAKNVETETADDFFLTDTTVIRGATITGLINAPLANITKVEVELYHVFGQDPRDVAPSGNVPSRTNSPSDNEIDSATRDSADGTLAFTAGSLGSFSVGDTVVDGINKSPDNRTLGEGPAAGEEVQITITFVQPIVLPAGHYFFRPEVLMNGGDFRFMSASTPVAPDLQAWIRNTPLAPDWLRIGTDIVGTTAPTAPKFNMTFSLAGNTVARAGTPGEPSCHDDTISAVARQFRGVSFGASTLGFPSVAALQRSFDAFCNS